jgi:hypothetical protein
MGWYLKNRLVATSLAVLGGIVFVSSAQAQGHGAFASAPAGPAGTYVGQGHGVRNGYLFLRRGRRFVAGSGYWPYFYSDYDSEPGVVEAAPPQTIVVQAAQPASPAVVSNPPESLMLELQGDHWVRITNHGQSQIGEQPSQPESERTSELAHAVHPATPRRTQAAEPPSELPPAVLVFRDGHEEEIRKYMILGATIYTSADYWSRGSWTRKIQIVELDVPATLKLNQERGAKFSLPSGPNEVMIRP